MSNLNARQNDITGSVLSEQLINELIHVREFHFFKINNNISFSEATFAIHFISPLGNCAVPENIHTPFTRDLRRLSGIKISWGWGTEKLKEMYDA